MKPTWEVTWENTVAAAKKEGRLNFYVGRYGSEKLLNEFRKEFPEIKIVSTHGSGNSLGTRIVSEARAGHVLADLYSGGAVTNFEILYKGKALDSLKSALLLPEVLDESKWYGGKHRYNDPGTAACVYLHRQSDVDEHLLQYSIWSIRKISNPSGISSIPGGRESLSPKSRPAPVSARRCNFSFTIPSWGRIFCENYSSISNPSIPVTGAR